MGEANRRRFPEPILGETAKVRGGQGSEVSTSEESQNGAENVAIRSASRAGESSLIEKSGELLHVRLLTQVLTV